MNNKHIRLTVILLAVVAIALSSGPILKIGGDDYVAVVAATVKTDSPQDRPITSLRDLNNAFIEIASEVKPTVVTVFTEKTLRLRQNPFLMNPFLDFFYGPDQRQQPEQEFRQQGLGSGVVIESDGKILTNHHVIAEADSIFVRTFDGKRYVASVLGSDPKTDIAVIEIEARDLPIIKVGNSDNLKVGELVMAVGSPMSENLAYTVTQGIVSATGRSNIGLADYEDFIQTDAAINPGNSGGALVNLDGELVGINSAIVSRSGGFQGIGFAVPSNMAVSVMNSLLANGKVIRGWLGVLIQDLDEALAEAMGVEVNNGALVGDVVSDSPAGRAGLEPGDVIVAMNDKEITNSAQLRNSVAATPPGTEVDFDIIRDGDRKRFTVELGELPSDVASTGTRQGLEDLLGFDVSNLTVDLARRYNLNPNLTGVVVTGIDQASAAFRSGLREGDVIFSVNRKRIETVNDFSQRFENAQKGDSVLLRIYRNENTFFLAFTL
ncbi:MAG: DegQ family serine endoprotease [Candidatus Zixiibacteriota bacterium]|nr:MAG: DegQ family serine endoprotease [candidate division Zixibacteria bacterium]